MSDLKFSWRQPPKSPRFASLAVLTLASFIGANLAIFTAIDSVLVRNLPFPTPDQLVTLFDPVKSLDPAKQSHGTLERVEDCCGPDSPPAGNEARPKS